MENLKKLTILHSNDMHGDFLAEEIDETLIGGTSRLSGYLNQVRQQEKNVLYVIAGDMFKGSVIDSEFQGLSTIEIMNLLSPDVATVGNHEIDYGIAHLLFLEKCARFPIVNANLFIKTNHTRLFTPYKVLEIDGLHLMFIGILTDDVLAQAKKDGLVGSFIDVREAAKEVAVICDTYKTTRIDYTILLTHIGFEKDKELAALIDTEWGVDLIIGGHSHTLLEEPCVVNGIPIVQAGTGTDQVGRFDLSFHADTGELAELKWKCLPITEETCPKDPAMDQLILQYKTHTDQKYQRLVTTFSRKLTHPARNQETELGNLFADTVAFGASFDIMLYGSGGIRKKELGPVVTLQGLTETVPLDDSLHLLEVTGEQLRRMFSFVLREEAYLGHTEFYQVSKGVRFVWSRSRQEFEEFKFKGKEIAPDQRLKIGLQKYHLANFDSFFSVPLEEVSRNCQPKLVATSVVSTLEELLSTSRHINAQVEGRLVVLP